MLRGRDIPKLSVPLTSCHWPVSTAMDFIAIGIPSGWPFQSSSYMTAKAGKWHYRWRY